MSILQNRKKVSEKNRSKGAFFWRLFYKDGLSIFIYFISPNHLSFKIKNYSNSAFFTRKSADLGQICKKGTIRTIFLKKKIKKNEKKPKKTYLKCKNYSKTTLKLLCFCKIFYF
jgi:hypothetical protein